MRMWQSLKYDFTVVAINIICITLQMTERFWTIFFFLVLRFDIATLTDHRRETTTQDSSRSERELGQALARDGHGVLSQSCLVTHSELAACQYNEKCRVLKFVRCDSHTHTTSSEHRKRWLWQHDQYRFDTIILISFVHPFVLRRAMKIMLPCICNVGRTFYPQKRLFVNLNILICWFCKHVLDIVNIKIPWTSVWHSSITIHI